MALLRWAPRLLPISPGHSGPDTRRTRRTVLARLTLSLQVSVVHLHVINCVDEHTKTHTKKERFPQTRGHPNDVYFLEIQESLGLGMLDKSCESNQLRSGFQLKMVVSFVRFVGMEIGLKCKCVESNYRGVYCVKNHTRNTNMSIPKWGPNVNSLSLSPFMCKSIYSSKSGEYIFNYLFRLPLETPRVFLTRQSKVGCVRNEAAERCLHHTNDSEWPFQVHQNPNYIPFRD